MLMQISIIIFPFHFKFQFEQVKTKIVCIFHLYKLCLLTIISFIDLSTFCEYGVSRFITDYKYHTLDNFVNIIIPFYPANGYFLS
jgi:hypothetical protein